MADKNNNQKKNGIKIIASFRLPAKIHEIIQKEAEQQHRFLYQQIIWILDDWVNKKENLCKK